MRIIQCALTLITAAACATAAPAVTAAVTAQAETTTAGGWPQFQGNASHTGDEPGETSVTPANVGQLTVAWTMALPTDLYNSKLVVTGGVAYAGAGRTVTAVNASSGALVWRASLPRALLGTPSVQDGLVLVAFSTFRHRREESFVVALESATGATAWTRRVGVLGTRTVPGSTNITTTPYRAYVTLASGQVQALSLRRGYKVWRSAVLASCGGVSQPSVAGGLVVVGVGGGYVSALNASDGKLAWTAGPGGGCGYSAANWLPAISGGTVYAGLYSGVVALSLASGTVEWENQSVSGVYFPLSVTGSAVLAGPDSGAGLVALSRSDGSVLWQDSLPLSGLMAGTATFGGLSWGIDQSLPGDGAEMIAYDPSTGQQDFSSAQLSTTAEPLFPPVVVAGRVYVNLGNELVCFALRGSG
jgi:outer membrane protein assembly factor BamB